MGHTRRGRRDSLDRPPLQVVQPQFFIIGDDQIGSTCCKAQKVSRARKDCTRLLVGWIVENDPAIATTRDDHVVIGMESNRPYFAVVDVVAVKEIPFPRGVKMDA